MKHIWFVRKKHLLSAALLLSACFALGLWLGEKLLPVGLIRPMFQLAGAAAQTLPNGQGWQTDESSLSAALLSSSGLPLPNHAAAPDMSSSANADSSVGTQRTPTSDGENNSTATGLLVISGSELEQRRQAAQGSADPTEPQVIIYSTHAGEEYAGQTRITGEAGGVMEAGRAMAEQLEQLGVGVIFVDTLHDSPSYNEAYNRSLETVTALAAEYPQVEIYIDVHRDSALAGVDTTLLCDGISYAKMMLIIGTDEKLPHPNWQQNYDFARQLTAACNGIVPAIMREPRVYSWRYNQHIAPRAILVEIGSNDNTEEEAKRSAAVLAQAISGLISH